jgi:hypothetical protein
MGDKLNCWQFKRCGREPGGSRAPDLGVCPAATETRTQSINSGKNGGRACWAVTGTLCGGRVQGVFAAKVADCMRCDFYLTAQREEGAAFKSAVAILPLLR